MIAAESLLLAALIGVGATLTSLWAFALLKTSDPSEATDWVSDKLGGLALGALASVAFFAGELVAVLTFTIDHILQIPAVLLALLGLGEAAGTYDLSPGTFAIAALLAFLIATGYSRRQNRA